jgi:hypothetical protein
MFIQTCERCRGEFQVPAEAGAAVRCPLCHEVIPISAVSSAPLVKPAIVTPVAAHPASPFDFDQPDRAAAGRGDAGLFAVRAIQRAGKWLGILGIVFLAYLFLRSGMDLIVFGRTPAELARAMMVGMIVRLVLRGLVFGALGAVLMAAASSLKRQQGRGLGITASILSIVVAGLLFLGCAASFLLLGSLSDLPYELARFVYVLFVIGIVLDSLVAIAGITGGIHALTVLSSGRCRQAFSSSDG